MTAPEITMTLDWETVARAGMHEIAITILQRLVEAGEPLSPSDLAEKVDAPLGVVSYHVRMLRDRELIRLDRSEPRRGALKHFYAPVAGLAVLP